MISPYVILITLKIKNPDDIRRLKGDDRKSHLQTGSMELEKHGKLGSLTKELQYGT